MEVVSPSFKIEDKIDGVAILKNLERYGRVCYKSENRTTPDSAKDFIRRILKSGHESVIEHEKVTVRVVCDRAIANEIVRHRLGSYSQESTRYRRYFPDGIRVIKPYFFDEGDLKYSTWLRTMQTCEEAYKQLIEQGATPEEARTVLPHSLATELVITYNLREWRHFFMLRCSRKAHPQMREITIPLLKEFQRLIPVLFDDIEVDA